MYAIIAIGGKQHEVSEGDIIRIEKLGVEASQTVTFDQVLAVNNGEMTVGAPTVSGASVDATVLRKARAKEVVVYKYKVELDYHGENGHRQLCTQVEIDKINA